MKMRCNQTFLLATLAAALLLSAANASAAGFSFNNTDGEHLDLNYDGKLVARYMYAFDQSNEERAHETYKPYLHIFDAAGEAPITKGAGGQYTHHRGIFMGFDDTGFDGKLYDFWHMDTKAFQVHQRFNGEIATGDTAAITSVIHWLDPDQQSVIEELRTMTFRKLADPGMLVVDFTSQLTAPNGDVELNGDPEHAGVQYRPANEVDPAKTRYRFPKEGADPKVDRDYPWVGETYTLNDKQYSVVHINHNDNPKDTIYSAYRDYGRFGAFFVTTVPKGETLSVAYRFVIKEGELPANDQIEAYRSAFHKGRGILPE